MGVSSVFVYRKGYAHIWDLLEPEEKRAVLYERVNHFAAYIGAVNFIKTQKYGSAQIPLPDDLEEELTIYPPPSPGAVPVPLGDKFQEDSLPGKVYKTLLKQPDLTASELQEITKINVNSIDGTMKRLRDADIVEIVGMRKIHRNNKLGYVYRIVYVLPK